MRFADLFAGWGGMSLGAALAGCEGVYAANHWPVAVAAHAANHPNLEHVCQDLRQADWRDLPPYDLLLASPACQGHSEAGQSYRTRPGVAPKHAQMRSTAWSIVDCADVTNPRAIVVENVPRMRAWRLYPAWRGALEALGYRLTEHVLLASHYGVPQRRTRIVIVGLRKPGGIALRPSTIEPAFGPCVEWTAPGMRPITQASPDARARIAAAQRNHGPRVLSQHTTRHQGVALDEPIRTITTKDQWIVVDGGLYRPLTLREYARAQSFPDSYSWPTDVSRATTIKGIGNAAPPSMMRAVVAAVREAA